jgi:hypothetical protein
MGEPDTFRWIGEHEVAKITGLSVKSLRNDRWLGRRLPYYKVGGSVRYRLDEVYKYMESKRVEVGP